MTAESAALPSPSHQPFAQQKWLWKLWLLIMGIGIACAALIPPLQSPDEGDHVTRAAILAQGTLLLQNRAGESTGGMIDSGLADYVSLYSTLWYHGDHQVTRELKDAVESIPWSGKLVFRTAPGTGYYFPGIYLPQALGLKTGQFLGMSVDRSYRLARLITMLCSSVLLVVAFGIFQPGILTVALLILPMTLFQFASATIDSTTIALTALALSLTFQAAQRCRISTGSLLVVSLIVFLVITSRAHMLPLLVILPAVYSLTRNKTALLAAALTTATTLVWLFTAMHRTVDLRAIQTSPTEAVIHYLHHPAALGKIFAATLSDSVILEFYQESFLGILGWLDAPFSDDIYSALAGLTLSIALLSLVITRRRTQILLRSAFILSALISCGLVFLLLLVTWTPLDAVTIRGVQGRYFMLPALVISYALHDPNRLQQSSRYRIFAVTLLVLMSLLIANEFPKLMIERYTLTSSLAAER